MAAGTLEFQEAVGKTMNTRIGPYIERLFLTMTEKIQGATTPQASISNRSMNGMSKRVDIHKDNFQDWTLKCVMSLTVVNSVAAKLVERAAIHDTQIDFNQSTQNDPSRGGKTRLAG